eukprot:CAMPEP_0171453538 /NCGR_PEP_ID=MMETSP0945-20130129/1203_1 /TAXON_ID=109269 /ORGANISM="Vaucheria litorea, Strain CCMP2940" /LENGTH=75 /DNA_ID=CAMNT_0011978419 /DNA_START=74 /DNA_END=301 /DNA_ORIENTATION=+
MPVHLAFKEAMIGVGGSIALASYLTTKLYSVVGNTPESVTNPKWREATKEYMKFQKMNPIGLGGRRAWDPDYLHK